MLKPPRYYGYYYIYIYINTIIIIMGLTRNPRLGFPQVSPTNWFQVQVKIVAQILFKFPNVVILFPKPPMVVLCLEVGIFLY
jgi:hypothetical protein